MAGDSSSYDASYRGKRTQSHPRYGEIGGGNDISATNAGKALDRRPREIDAAINAATNPSPPASAPARVTDAPKGGISFEKADPERAKKRKAGPPASML